MAIILNLAMLTALFIGTADSFARVVLRKIQPLLMGKSPVPLPAMTRAIQCQISIKV